MKLIKVCEQCERRYVVDCTEPTLFPTPDSCPDCVMQSWVLLGFLVAFSAVVFLLLRLK